MPQANEEEYFICRKDGTKVMRFFLSEVNEVTRRLKWRLDAERRGVVSFGRLTKGEHRALDTKNGEAAQQESNR